MALLTHILATALLISYYTPAIPVLGKQTYLKDCPPLRCSKDGPIVRYPFRLGTQAPNCGYETLVLSCSGGNTVLSLLSSGDYNVTSIDYQKSMLAITRYSWTPNCPWSQITEPNITGSLFIPPPPVDLSWFDCSDVLTSFSENEYLAPIPCLKSEGHFMYVALALTHVSNLPSTCTKTRNSTFFTGPKVAHQDYGYAPSSFSEFQDMIRDFAATPVVALYWQDELINCSICEKKWWHRCEFDFETKRSFCRESHMVLKAGISVSAISLLLLGGFVVFYVRRQSKKKKTVRQKIENFLRSYRVMNSTRYTYDDLKKITKRFKKRIGAGAFGTVYKGELPNGIPVAVKMLHRSACGGEQFVNEVATIGRIHHVHVVRLLGFCSDRAKQALVYEFMENGSLDKYIFSTRWRNRQFSMEEMLVVATGIAEGMEYLHQGMNPTRYTYDDLKKITKRFKNKIGDGAFGTVYKGKLPNRIPVAIKMLHRSGEGGEQFVNEVATIGRNHHVLVLRLLGFCSEGAKQALVYEFMENGSLDKYIFSSRWRNRQFSMEEMLVVATGIAEGIEYLHQGCDQRNLHFDIKPHNILLDHNLVPKISDFGLSKLCPKDQSYLTISAARGTMGYLAPEMYSRNFGPVSYKSDVYSFGMLILEMISGRKNIDPLRGGGVRSEDVYFPEWIYELVAQGKDLCLVLDVGGNGEIAKKLAIVALWCIQWSPEDRPSMTRIFQMLGENLQNLQLPPNPVMPSYCVGTSGQGI